MCIGMEQVKFFNFLNRIVHEVLGFAPVMIVTIFFCDINIFPLLDKLPQKIIPRFIME